MYKISGDQVELVEPDTFAYLKWTEQDIEELVRKNIDMICDEEESMLIVGRQVRNESNGISDLTAIDNNGNLVLIEIKRDRKDILNRKEAFEFQAIRYAASYATIQTPEDLVERIYAPYIGRYREEFSSSSLTNVELAARKLQEFLETNHATQTFNQAQRIILLASDYDEQTLSAVSWLNSNNVDIGCYKLIPYRLEEHLYIRLEKLLPLTKNEDYYIPFSLKSSSQATSKDTISRRNLPKIKEMLDWGVVKPGDIIMPKDREGEGVLTESGHVEVNGEELSLQKWLKEIYGWSSIQTYAFAIHKDRGISLSQIRKKYILLDAEHPVVQVLVNLYLF